MRECMRLRHAARAFLRARTGAGPEDFTFLVSFDSFSFLGRKNPQGVLAAFDPSKALFGWLETLLSLSLFCAALMYTRWRFQYQRRLAGES